MATTASHVMKSATAFAAVLFLIVLPPMGVAASNLDAADVREVIAGLMRSWNVHDMHAFAELFTEDASFVNVNGSWLRNRAQIEESHKVVHASIFRNSRTDITPSKVRFPKADVSVVHAKWQVTGDSRSPQARNYVMTLILLKQHDGWKILAAQNASTEDRSTIGFANLRPGDVAPIPALKAQSSPPAAEDHIDAVISAFDSAWNRRNPLEIAALFATKADLVDASARWVEDKQKIATHIAKVEMPEFKDAVLTSGVERLVLMHPDLAFAQLRWKLERSDSPSTPTQGMGLRVLQESGASWRILAAEDTIIRAPGQ
jgi:uncharacterized protein (TIGR02246 family)